MKVRLDKISPTPSGLVCGVCVLGPKHSWIRFALLQVPYESIPPEFLQNYTAWLDRGELDIDRDTPMEFDWA